MRRRLFLGILLQTACAAAAALAGWWARPLVARPRRTTPYPAEWGSPGDHLAG